jgi:hypothetical protein
MAVNHIVGIALIIGQADTVRVTTVLLLPLAMEVWHGLRAAAHPYR